MIAPEFEKLEAVHPEAVLVKVDVDDAQDIAGACGISCMPTFKFFKGNKLLETLEGANLPVLKAKIAALK